MRYIPKQAMVDVLAGLLEAAQAMDDDDGVDRYDVIDTGFSLLTLLSNLASKHPEPTVSNWLLIELNNWEG